MTKTLFIDLDGTLCHDRFWRSLDPDLMDKVQQHLFQSGKATVIDWMNGVHTSEDINRKLAEDLNISYDHLWSIFVKDCQQMKVENVVLEKLKALKKQYKLVLITDNMDCFDRFTVPALKLNEYFDLIVNSFNERTSKNENDGQLFQEVMERVGSTPSESILMDNSEKSCKVFTDLGGKSLLVTKDRPLFYWLNNFAVNE